MDNPEEEPVDENTEEDAGPAKDRRARVIDFESHKDRQDAKGGRTKKNPSLSDSLEKLPRQVIYDLNVDALNEQYG